MNTIALRDRMARALGMLAGAIVAAGTRLYGQDDTRDAAPGEVGQDGAPPTAAPQFRRPKRPIRMQRAARRRARRASCT